MLKAVVIAASLVTVAAAPAYALRDPVAGNADSRMRSVPYNPDDVIRIPAPLGSEVMIEFGPEEHDIRTASVASKDIKAEPLGHFLFLKPLNMTLNMQPLLVLTTTVDGKQRPYAFELDVRDFGAIDANTNDTVFRVKITYPGDDAARAKATASWRAQQAGGIAAQKALHATAVDNSTVPCQKFNCHYVGQGNETLKPDKMWDDGQQTTLYFAGNRSIPLLYQGDCRKHKQTELNETVVDFTIESSGEIVVHQVLPALCLRHGDAAMVIWNKAYDPVGKKPDSGTISPRVERTTMITPPAGRH